MQPTLALIKIGDIGEEALAIRSTLEYFGFRVISIPVGRPADLMAVLRGETLYPDVQFLLLCAHGREGKIWLPELEESLYKPDEPRGFFGPEEVRQFGNLPGISVLATGCTLGEDSMAQAFLSIGCQAFIGPVGYVEGNAALIFVQLLFYHLSKGEEIERAVEMARGMDEETHGFCLQVSKK